MQRLLGTPGGPVSGMVGLLKSRLLQVPTTRVPPRVVVTIDSRVKGKRVENELFKLFKRAERLHATSFRDRDLQRCIDANVEVVKQLREAIDMGSFQARACLADMLLNGYTAGVRKDVREAMSLVSKVDDPDCQGVLAHCHFNDGIKAGPALAARSAACGSKYGQLVLGLYEMQKWKTKEASGYFTLAAAQNYDEAQIALSKMQSDPNETLRLLNLAADQGNLDAFYLIADLYRRKSNNNPHKPEFIDAMMWCNLALQANHPYAYDMFNSMRERMRWS
jgi:TPR repeat protein